MNCFIHMNTPAISVCKKCGKAMCADCSAYSNHTGICPECRRGEFIKERDNCSLEAGRLSQRIESLNGSKVGKIALTVLIAAIGIATFFFLTWYVGLCIIAVAGIYCAVKLFGISKEVETCQQNLNAKNARINALTKEIDRLGEALNKGSGPFTI